jgi:beta-catenin-like protein 1
MDVDDSAAVDPRSSSSSSSTFIPSSSWQGTKAGYFFGTGDRGTGYHRDDGATKNTTHVLTTTTTTKSKKRARFDESANETAVIVDTSSPSTTTRWLELAEEAMRNNNSSKVIISLTPAGVQSAAHNLQKAMEQNALQRAQAQDHDTTTHPDPTVFMESELALYEAIVSLKALAAAPESLYPVLVQQTETMEQLVQLLMHDNVDIAVAVASVLLEWFDPELFAGGNQKNDSRSTTTTTTTTTTFHLVASFCESGAAEWMVENLARMSNTATTKAEQPTTTTEKEDDDEDDDEVGRGVEDILSIFENIMEIETNSVQPILQQSSSSSSSIAGFLARQTKLISWLLENIRDDNPTRKPRCLELLAYMVSREDVHATLTDWKQIPCYSSTFLDTTSIHNRNKDKNQPQPTLDGMEILLQCVATFRKRHPVDETEVEILENACIILTAALTYNHHAVQAFLQAQGIELVLRCLRERVYAGAVTLPWLEFTGADSNHRKACEHMVHAGALKYLFPVFLGRNLPKHYHEQEAITLVKQKKKDKKEFLNKMETTVIRILYGLVRHLRDDSPEDAKQRLLAKFADPDGSDKVARLVDLLVSYDQKTRLAEYNFFRSDAEEALSESGTMENREQLLQLAALDAKLAGGGDILHRLAAIAAFCCVGSRRCHEQILSLLKEKELGMGLIRDALEEFVSVLGDLEQKKLLEGYLEQI